MQAQTFSAAAAPARGTPDRDTLAPYRFAFLWSATALATYQIYFLPALGTYFPLSLLLAYASLFTVRLRESDRGLATLFGLYAALVFVCGAWSPDFGAWANAIVYGFLFFYGFFVARSFSDSQPIVRIVNGFLLFATANAAMVIVFRFAPGIEDAYFSSPLQDIFKNPKLVANLELFRPNVLDVTKAGGVFDNANTGATFSLICLGATIATLGTRSRFMSAVYLLLFSGAVLCSGSKSAIIIYGAAVLAALMVPVLELRNAYLKTMLFSIAGFVVSMAVIGPLVLEGLSDSVGSSDFGQDVSQTSEYRLLLWRAARLTFLEHPLTGLGYGGWGENLYTFAATGVNVNWPAHNSLIQTWSDSGLLALIVLVSFWGLTFLRLARRIGADRERTPAVGAAFAMGCCAAMSMGDTFPLLGNLNMALPLGVLVAWGLSDRAQREPGGAEGSPDALGSSNR